MIELYKFLLDFAGQHWFLAWCSMWLLWAPCSMFLILPQACVTLVTRTYRAILILLRGWPPEHLDADGDWQPHGKN